MHPECHDFVAGVYAKAKLGDLTLCQGQVLVPQNPKVLEIGSAVINGGVRKSIFGDASEYLGVDQVSAFGVDVVADAASWCPPSERDHYNVVVCLEVFEHAYEWPKILANMYRMLAYHGLLILTAATDPRAPHSAIDGRNLLPHEYSAIGVLPDVEFYENVHPDHLRLELLNVGFDPHDFRIHVLPRGDVQVLAVKS